MRLINVHTLELETFHESERPTYACLSHRWGNDIDEVSFQDYARRHEQEIQSRPGWEKLLEAVKVVGTYGLSHLWVDTCCIDKTSSTELSEAINSMWQWYKNCEICLAYLADVDDTYEGKGRLKESSQPFRESQWFRRAWTLQELLAPKTVDFYNQSWRFLGSKSRWAKKISNVTGIDEDAVARYHQDKGSSGRGWLFDEDNYTVVEKMCWAAGRESTRVEDRAYSLLGLFDLNLPLLYGEGDKAFVRLQEEILRKGDDLSLLEVDRYVTVSESDRQHGDWQKTGMSNLLPRTPDMFRPSKYRFSRRWHQGQSRISVIACSVTNVGLNLDILTMPWSPGIYIGLLPLNILRTRRRYFNGKWSIWRFREYFLLPLITQEHLLEPNIRLGRHMYICTDKGLFARQQAYLANYDADTMKDEHDEWWYQSTIKQDILLLPKCHAEWQDPGIVNGVSIQVDDGDIASEYEWFDRAHLPYGNWKALKLEPGPQIYLKPVGTWFLNSADGDTYVEFGFDMYQEFVCAFVHREKLVSTFPAKDLKIAAPAIRSLWSGSLSTWQNKGKFSYRHEVEKDEHDELLMRIEIHMYKSNQHHGFMTDEHFGKRVMCSLESHAYNKRNRYIWCLHGGTIGGLGSRDDAWHGALGFQSSGELCRMIDSR